MNDLLDRFRERCNAGIEHDQRNDHGAEVFGPPVSERMLSVRGAPGQLGSDDRDHGRACVGQVVHGIQGDGDGVHQNAHHGLESGQKNVGKNSDQAGAHNLPVAAAALLQNFLLIDIVGRPGSVLAAGLHRSYFFLTAVHTKTSWLKSGPVLYSKWQIGWIRLPCTPEYISGTNRF